MSYAGEEADSSDLQPLKSDSTPSTDLPAAPCSYLDLLRPLPVRFKTMYVIGALHGMLIGVIFSTMITALGQIFDESTNEDEDDYDMSHEVRKVALVWLMLGVAVIYAGYVATYCLARASQQVGKSFKTLFFHSIVHKDSAYYDTHNASEIAVRLGRDGELVEAGTGDKFLIFVEMTAFCLVTVGQGFLKSPQLFLVGLSVVPLGLLGNVVFGIGMMLGAQMKEEAYVKAGAISEESLGEMKTVSAFNAQSFISNSYNEELKKPMGVMSTMGTIKGIGYGLVWMGWMLTGAVVFWVAAKWISDERKNWILRDDIEGADAIVIYWFVIFFFCNVGQIFPGVQAVMEAKMAGGRILAFVREPAGIVNGTRQVEIEGKVEFRSVQFAYPKHPDRPVLKGLSFSCEKGEKTAIVGESGAGKSTIIQLMERFYEPSAGQILYDGVNLAEMDLAYLRKQVGYVGQEPVLFNMSIGENIRLGKLEATAEEVEAAAKEANAYEFISSLEEGFKTDVGVKGSKLSGGQKQRIAIARAIIKKPKILLLDEATSALDNTSEEIVLKALNAIHQRQGMTMISVAQKLSTIRGCDKIVVLREGRVEEEGSHEALIARDGLYAQMCAAQGSVIEESVSEKLAALEDKPQEERQIEDKAAANEESGLSVIKDYPLLRIVGAMMQYWPLLLIGALATVVAGCMYPALGYFVGKLSTYISGPSGGTMEHNVRKMALWMLIFSVITFISFSVSGWAFSVMSSRIVKALREECFWKLLHLDAHYFDSAQQSNLLAQSLNSDAEKTNDAGGPLFATLLILIVAYATSMLLCYFWQWKLTLVMAVVIPMQSFCIIRCWMVHLGGPTHPQYKHAAALAQDAILNVKTLRACEGQNELERKYDQYLQNAFNATDEELRYNSL